MTADTIPKVCDAIDKRIKEMQAASDWLSDHAEFAADLHSVHTTTAARHWHTVEEFDAAVAYLVAHAEGHRVTQETSVGITAVRMDFGSYTVQVQRVADTPPPNAVVVLVEAVTA